MKETETKEHIRWPSEIDDEEGERKTWYAIITLVLTIAVVTIYQLHQL